MQIKRFALLAVAGQFLFFGLAAAEEAPPFPSEPPAASAAAAAPQKGGGKLTLDIKGMDIVDVLKMLATRSGMNLVIGKNVTGRVTLFLKDVDTWDAFEIILLANDLAYEKKGDIINVMTQRDYELIYGERYQDKKQAKIVPLKYAKAADVSRALVQMKTNIGRVVTDETFNKVVLIDAPEKLKEMEDFIKATDLPLRTEVFGLNYAQAEKVGPKLQEALTKGVGSIKVDERTNKLIITDFPEKIEEFRTIIAAFDEKTQQVLIDAQIIEITPQDKLEVGVNWDYWIKKYFDFKLALPINTTGALIVGTKSGDPSGVGKYKAIVDLLRTIGDTKILSSPRIMALNNQEAKILVGTQDAYVTSTTSQGATSTTVTSQTVNFLDVGIKLFVTPTINRDGFVTMKIRPEISSSTRTDITSEGKITQVPIKTTSEAETTVMVKDGVTIIIGGLRKDKRIKNVKKVPVLGDIPIIGHAFRNTSDDLTKTDLVILLTPHIMTGESAFTDFAQTKPSEGAIAKMEGGEIVLEKVSGGRLQSLPQKAPFPIPFFKKGENLLPEIKRVPPLAEGVEEQAGQPLTAELTGAGAVPEGNEERFSYYRMVTEKIDQIAQINPPEGKKGQVEVNFKINAEGNLSDEPQVVESTDSALNDFALRAVKDASPFPSFPADLEKKEEIFKVSLHYE